MDSEPCAVADDAGARLREPFERGRAMTVGVEEELLLVDPETLDLVSVADDLVPALGDPERFRKELSAAQIEILTPVCATAAEAAGAIRTARREVIGRLSGRAGCGSCGNCWLRVS